mgnify:FL=1
MVPITFEDNELTIEVPTKSYLEIMSKQFGKLMTGFIYNEFGVGVSIRYTVKK